ncbi:MAG: hypothetical protein NTV63_01290 [Candidatus Woesearchaeota archaeon]|nr:hypothetical protein [Candidatus Woesearchaeota archaeon]
MAHSYSLFNKQLKQTLYKKRRRVSARRYLSPSSFLFFLMRQGFLAPIKLILAIGIIIYSKPSRKVLRIKCKGSPVGRLLVIRKSPA